jgi:hypothetical protein
MDEPFASASDYRPDRLQLVRQACLSVALTTGELRDCITVLGGLVPSLLIPEPDSRATAGRLGTARWNDGP